MTEDLRDFIVRTVDSPLKLELITYFHRNRFTMDYAEGTAQRVGADPQRVQASLEELVTAGIVQQRQSAFNSSRPPVFSYTRDPGIRRLVGELSDYLSHEDGRKDLLALMTNREKGEEE